MCQSVPHSASRTPRNRASFTFSSAGTFDGGAGNDTYYFAGSDLGPIRVVEDPEPGADPSVDTLDFSGFTGGAVALDLNQRAEQ